MQIQAETGDDQIKADWISAFKLLSRLNQTTDREMKSTPLLRTLLEDLQSIYM